MAYFENFMAELTRAINSQNSTKKKKKQEPNFVDYMIESLRKASSKEDDDIAPIRPTVGTIGGGGRSFGDDLYESISSKQKKLDEAAEEQTRRKLNEETKADKLKKAQAEYEAANKAYSKWFAKSTSDQYLNAISAGTVSKKEQDAFNAQQQPLLDELKRTSDVFQALKEEEDKANGKEFMGLDIFQKGAFEGGVSAKTIAQAVLGTTGEVTLELGRGVGNFVEGLTDAYGYSQANAFDALGFDGVASKLRKAADKGTVNSFLDPADKFLEDYSVLGNSTDFAVSGVGQIAPIIATGFFGKAAGLGAKGVSALTKLLQGTSAYGHGVSEARNDGATDGEANVYGLLSAGAEVLGEMLFSNMGKAAKSAGVDVGAFDLDDVLAKKLGNLFTSKAWKNAAQGFVKSVGEGVEESVTGLMQGMAKRITYMTEENPLALLDIAKDENLWEQFFVGMLTGEMVQSVDVHKANKADRDLITGLNDDEQTVVDKLVEDEIAKAKKNGKKVKKGDIEAEITEKLKKGFVSVDDIERVLGGDSYTEFEGAVKGFNDNDIYKAYNEADAESQKLTTEFEELKKVKRDDSTLGDEIRIGEIQKRMEELKAHSEELRKKLQPEIDRINAIQGKLRNEVSTRVKDGYMAESYRELIRSTQKFQADPSKYKSEAARKTIQNLIDGGIANNTNEFREFADLMTKIADDKGAVFDITDNKRLKGTRFEIKGATVNAFVTNDGHITINKDSKQRLNSLVGHEVSHVLEGTQFYTELQKAVKQYATAKGEWDSRLQKVTDLYKKHKPDADPVKELTADLIGEYVFTDRDFVMNLSTKNRNVFKKVYDEIKYMAKIATAGTKEARELARVKKVFEEVWRTTSKNPTKTEHSLSPVEAVEPTSDKWHRTHTTEEVKSQFPDLWDIVAEESDSRNPTQIAGTVRSYRKVYDALKAEGFTGTILDASSGMGFGTKAGIEEYGFDVEDIEPYPDKSYNPKYKDYSALDKKYDAIISNAVLNVLPQEQRDALVVKMGEMLNDGGRIFVNVRGADVKNASSKVAIDESAMEYYIAEKGTYQKGFTKAELVAYLQDALGDGFTVEPTSMFGAVSAVVTKKADVQYSLSEIVDENNKSYGIGVHLDSTLLDGLSQDERLEMVKEYIKELGGESFTAYDGNGNAVNISIAEPKEKFKNHNGKKVYATKDLTTKYIGNEVKQEAIALIDELVVAAEHYNSEAPRYPHGWLDNNGQNDWDYWKTYIQDKNNTIWEATLNIANTADGRKILYDINPIKKVGRAVKSATISTGNNIPQNTPVVNDQFSLSDSGGNQLSDAQAEFFKDSVVRDENGNLKVMYHGTSKGGFTVFDTYGSNYGLFGTGSYFTDSKTIGESYTKKGKGKNPQVYEAYLNIKNPMDMDAQANPAEWQKAFEDVDFPESGTNEQFYRAVEEFYADQWMSKWEVAEEIQATLESGMGYDGITHIGGGRVNADGERHRVYIAFNPEQIKAIDNQNPTSDPDIRYSLTEDSDGNKLTDDVAEFFKDSKTVDANGNLQVLYHGSRSEAFSWFDLYEGVWLTSDPRYAEVYAGQWHSWRDDFAPVGEGRTDLNGLEPEVYADPDYRIYKMYANIKNPADIGELDIPLSDAKVRQLAQALGMRYTELKPLADTFMEEETYMLTRSREFIELAKEKGFDGFKATEKGKETWCAFASEDQVKLTTNATPTSNEDIRYSLSEDSDVDYGHIMEMQVEVNKLTNEIREFENTEEFKAKMNEFFGTSDVEKGINDYLAWREESGYDALIAKRDSLEDELEKARKRFDDFNSEQAVNEEKDAIAKSGLSEADYFRKQAVKEFGYTPYFYDAGYITPNGKMLNFSGEKGKHYGSRGQDHRAIGIIYADTQGSTAMVRFMNDGNIRIMAETPGLDISSSVEPTREQYASIRKFIRESSGEGFFAVDISDADGRNIGTYQYNGRVFADRVVNDIKYFYQTGKMRESSGLTDFLSISAKGDVQRGGRGYAVYGDIIGVRSETGFNPLADIAPIGENVMPVAKNVQPVAKPAIVGEPATAADAEAAQSLYSISDNDAPPVMDAPMPDEQPATPHDPFAEKNIEDVGKRNVHAYMFDHPEVKPYFQHEANIMLGELRDTVKGERIYNEDGGWTGTSRHTSEDIAYLRDALGYTYAEIEKGLNAIIEDNGKENIAVAKKIEFLLNDRLLKGYRDFATGMDIPANEGYVRLMNNGQMMTYDDGYMDALVASEPPPVEDIAPVMTQPTTQTNSSPVATQPVADALVREEYEAIRPQPQEQPKMVEADDIAPVYGDKLVRADSSPYGEERSWVQTSTGSEVVDGKILPEGLDQELTHYQPISNKTTLDNANAMLSNMGYEKSVEYLNGQFANNKVKLDDVALGERLIQEAIKRGDTKTAGDLIMDISILGTELGQKVQALSIIKRLTPEGQLRMLQRTIERGKTNKDPAFDGVELKQEHKDNILKSRNEDGSYDQKKLNKAVEDAKQDLADQMKVTKMDVVNAWRYLAMLGNPKTHLRNIVSNVAMSGTVAVKNAVARTAESIVDFGAHVVGKKINRTKTWRPATDAVVEFAKQTAIDMKDVIAGDSKYSDAESIKDLRKIFTKAWGGVGKVVDALSNFNSDAMSAEDSWFSRPAFRSALREYLTANGIRTEEDIQKNKRIVEQAKQYALEQSLIATFRQRSHLATKLNEMERKNAVYQVALGSVIPFKKTPINVAKAGLNYSPVGFLKTLTYDVSQVKKGNMDASTLIDHLSQNFTGTALTLLGYALAQGGVLNGGGEDDKEGKYDYQLGEQSYSITIDGNTYSLSWLSPVAMPLFVGANMYEQMVEGKEWNGNVVVETLAKTLDPLSEMSFVSSLNDVLTSYGSGTEKIAGVVTSAGQNYITQFVPTFSSQIAATMDENKRTTAASKDSDFKFLEETVNQIKYKIPGLRQTLQPSLDIWGNEIKQSEDVGIRAVENFIAPWSTKNDITTIVDRQLKSLYRETGENGVLPASPDGYIVYKNDKYNMSANEYTAYKETYGQTAYATLEELFNTDTYYNSTPKEQADLVEKVYEYARDVAKKELLADRNVEYTNATKDGVPIYKEAAIKGAIENDMPPDEHTYSQENPEKYKFLTDNGITYKKFKAFDDDTKDAYAWAFDNQGKYHMAEVVYGDFPTYYQRKKEMDDFDAKDEYGNTVNGLKKKRIFNYIESLPLDAGEKMIMFKSYYKTNDDYNYEIIDYLNGRADISYQEMNDILIELGFKIEADGRTITWD